MWEVTWEFIMKIFTIHSKTGRLLYEGRYASFKACLEAAVADNANLENADLRNQNLCNAMLDDGNMRRADFTNSNLTGANASEADLQGAMFTGADLYNTCLACADLRGARFESASFGATDIAGADISHAVLSTLSCFSLDFILANDMTGYLFIKPDGKTLKMNQPQIVLKGVSDQLVIFMDEGIMTGSHFFSASTCFKTSRNTRLSG